MSNKFLTVGLLVTLVIAIGGLFSPQIRAGLGAVSPSDISATNFTEVTASNGMYIGAGGLTVNSGDTNLLGTLTQGGGVNSKSPAISTSTVYLLQADLKYGILSVTAGTSSAMTLQLPATSTLTSFVSTAGQSTRLEFVNASTTGPAITVTAGTGETIYLSGSSTSTPAISGGKRAILDFFKQSNGNVDVIMSGTN